VAGRNRLRAQLKSNGAALDPRTQTEKVGKPEARSFTIGRNLPEVYGRTPSYWCNRQPRARPTLDHGRDRARLRVMLALPRADRTARRRPGGTRERRRERGVGPHEPRPRRVRGPIQTVAFDLKAIILPVFAGRRPYWRWPWTPHVKRKAPQFPGRSQNSTGKGFRQQPWSAWPPGACWNSRSGSTEASLPQESRARGRRAEVRSPGLRP
jgi:hypothetical protein